MLLSFVLAGFSKWGPLCLDLLTVFHKDSRINLRGSVADLEDRYPLLNSFGKDQWVLTLLSAAVATICNTTEKRRMLFCGETNDPNLYLWLTFILKSISVFRFKYLTFKWYLFLFLCFFTECTKHPGCLNSYPVSPAAVTQRKRVFLGHHHRSHGNTSKARGALPLSVPPLTDSVTLQWDGDQTES